MLVGINGRLIRVSICTYLTTLFVLSAFSQNSQVASESERDHPPHMIRVTVDLVHVDAIVTDKKRRHVTDLQREDFEIFWDGHPQEISNFSYVSTGPPVPKAIATSIPPESHIRPTLSTPRPDREQVNRTIAFVVDDLGLSFRAMAAARSAVRRFLDQQIEAGDLVAILRTGGGIASIGQFTFDKRVLHLVAEQLRMNPLRRGRPSDPDFFDRLERYNRAREEHFTLRTLESLQFIVNGMSEMPGRKSVILFSEGFEVDNFNPDRQGEHNRDRIIESVRRVTDASHRAAVVIHSIDPSGLQTLGLTASDDLDRIIYGGKQPRVGLKRQAGSNTGRTKHLPENVASDKVRKLGLPAGQGGTDGDPHAETIGKTLQERHTQHLATHASLYHLAEETGGLFFANTNDVNRSLNRVLEDLKGYYLIGFIPADVGFEADEDESRFQRIEVKLKRPGLKVRARAGAFGAPRTAMAALDRTPKQKLFSTLMSPFAGDIGLNLTCLVGYDPSQGLFVRSLLHVDAQDLSFREDSGGSKVAGIEILAAAFGESDRATDAVNKAFDVRTENASYEQVLRQGLVFSMKVPVKNPGDFQFRVAVHDRGSDKVGSASRFVKIPDVGKRQLALSGIVLRGEDVQAAENLRVADEDLRLGPAIREFRPGTKVQYALFVYNARLDHDSRQTDLETRIQLFRRDQTVDGWNVSLYEFIRQIDTRSHLVNGYLQLAPQLEPGYYALQYVVTDKPASEKHGTTTGWTDFSVVH